MARLDPVTVPTCSGLIPQRSYLSALPPKADMCSATRNVRFVPIADIRKLRAQKERPVCTENLNPDVMVMQSAEYRVRLDIPDSLNGTKGRRIFVQ